MEKTAQYIISTYSKILSYSTDKILNVGYQSKNGDPIPSFDENLLIDLCLVAREIFERENNILKLQGDFVIVGDIHGSFHDLLRILKFIHENHSKALFLGNFIDRGSFSLECITLLFAMKVIQPDSFYLIRGNHEFDSICSQYGFKSEIINHHNPKKIANHSIQRPKRKKITKSASLILQSEAHDYEQEYLSDEYFANHKDMNCYKYTNSLYQAFIDAFSYLPIGALINGTTFCVHGGLSPKIDHVDDLNILVDRPTYEFEESKFLSDIVWSDPTTNDSSKFSENSFGGGYLFNEAAVTDFLNRNSLRRIVRAHQCVKKGHFMHFGNKCITVFSSSSYDKFMGNYAAVIRLFLTNDQVRVAAFAPIHRLQRSEAGFFRVAPIDNESQMPRNCFSIHHPNLLTAATLKMVTSRSPKKIRPQNSDSSILMESEHLRLVHDVKPPPVSYSFL